MRVDDGQWHRVKVLRKRRIGVLQVDKTRPSRGKSEAGASILNTDGKIWIGKVNSVQEACAAPNALQFTY